MTRLYDTIAAATGIPRKDVKTVLLAADRVPNYYGDVGAFHERFNLPRRGDGEPAQLLPEDVADFRTKFLVEELQEFRDAHAAGNLADAADALADLVYVALGTAQMMRLPFDEIWAEVQRANMTKVRANGAADPRSTRGHVLDVVKPEGFRPPDVAGVIERLGS